MLGTLLPPDGDERTPRIKSENRERGQASMIDFAGAMLLRVAGYLILVLAGTALVMFATGPGYADYATATASADRLADDLLVDTPNDARANRTCTRAFFAQTSPGGCGFDESWPDDEGAYLGAALAVESASVNATVRTPNGAVVTLDGVPLALGETPPDEATVRTWQRHVGLDRTGDGTAEYATVEVMVW